MTPEVALILGIDGLASGAVYLLAGLGLVLIFSVTRVVFVPFGDIAAFAALSLAAFETGRMPATVGMVATLAVLARGRVLSLDGQGLVRRATVGDLAVDADYDPEVLRHVGVLDAGDDRLDDVNVVAAARDDHGVGALLDRDA